VTQGNLALERVRQFPILQINDLGELVDLLEPGDPAVQAVDPSAIFVSMNCWLLGPLIFRACRAIAPSPSGELELPEAVRYAMRVLKERFRVLTFRKGVLDLSTRADIPTVARLLAGREVHL
jgi:hypothetical protein